MRRSRAPGVVLLVGVMACLLAVPAAATLGDDGGAGGESAASGTSAAPGEAAAPATTEPHARRGRGFICERTTVAVEAGSASYTVKGTVAVGSATCEDCCQENILFNDGFETGNTSAWSATSP